jgi:Tat protein translocase TatC
MANPTGEMPFLDHLEELRGRIFRALAAIVVCVGLGIWAVYRFKLLVAIQAPVASYLPDHKLNFLSPLDPAMALLKIGVIFGLVLASPVIIYQIWAFLSPALYAREKKAMVPALLFGLVLFLLGGFFAWRFVLPMALRFLMNFQADALNPLLTFDEYLSFVVQLILALGIAFELPLVMILLAFLGIMSAKRYSSFRPYAILLNAIAGAALSPGTDVFSMLVFTGLLLLLYEIGVVGSYLVQRRKRLRDAGVAGLILLAMLAAPRDLRAQNPPIGQGGLPAAGDTAGRSGLGQGVPRKLDSATAKRLGIPTGPTNVFPSEDSLMNALLRLKGFEGTRIMGDSITFFTQPERVEIHGAAGLKRREDVMEALAITYNDSLCELVAQGEPKMFQAGQIVVGRALTVNTCTERAVVGEALTQFDNWFIRGRLAVDSSAKRLYAASSEITSCDLPEPHYHFGVGEMKYVSQSVVVARPAVLYVRDVPVAWLPFLFQDTRPGRRSGILIPQFGFNDIVRPTRTYNRQVTNLGYYWAPNDYFDLTTRFDWYANRYTQYGAEARYHFLDRFIDGSVDFNQQRRNDGSISSEFRMNHKQDFNTNTHLTIDADYVTNTRVAQSNSIDPLLSTQQILSSATLNKRLRWGQVTLGGNRRQNLSDGSGTMQLPTLTVQPKPFDFGEAVTWSPSLSFTNETRFKQPLPLQTILNGGGFDSLSVTGSSRQSTLNLDTPLRIGGFNWRNTLTVTDQRGVARTVVTQKVADSTTADPTDSITVSRVQNGSYSSGINLQTGINLPILFRGSWKITPGVGIRNVTAGPLLLRSPGSNGGWVQQGVKLSLTLAAAPTLFGYINRAIGPASRIRHTLSPTLNFQYSPSASVSPVYADAYAGATGSRPLLTAPATMTMSVGLSQNLEAKLKPAPGDTSTDPTHARKLRLLGWTTSSVSYDFEQAKEPGRTGWTTSTLTNSFQTDLLPGFSLSLTHDLWQGQVGTDTARLSPFLSNVSTNFTLGSGLFRTIGRLFGLTPKAATTQPVAAPEPQAAGPSIGPSPSVFRPGAFRGGNAMQGLTNTGFSASITYNLSRQRPGGGSGIIAPILPTGFGDEDPTQLPPPIPLPTVSGSHSNVGLNLQFAPTRFWLVSWQTQYNFTDGKFESQNLRLQRDLHDWRASFNFMKSPNGNFALYFSVYLLNLPDIKFDYNQTTLERKQ